MQPDQQSNYWQHDPDEEKQQTAATPEPGTYTPEPFVPETVPQAAQAPQVSAIPPVTQSIDEAAAAQPLSLPEDQPVHWTAHEYVHSERNGLWFVIFCLVVIGLIALDILFLKSYTFSVLVLVMAVAMIVYIRRPPHELQYTLSGSQGLYIGERLYHFSEFKSFGLIKDGEQNSLMLIPVKRFSPGVSVFFPEEVGEEVVDILGTRLPMEELKLDMIDVVVRKLRL